MQVSRPYTSRSLARDPVLPNGVLKKVDGDDDDDVCMGFYVYAYGDKTDSQAKELHPREVSSHGSCILDYK